jgi:low temperature requirement protein LtrA
MNTPLRRWRPGEGRKVLWIELFYDLIFVATIILLGNVLSHDLSWRGVALYALLFVPVWWAWSGMMFLFNRFIADDPPQRLLVLTQMFAIALLATQVGGAFGEQSAGFAAAYAAVRALLLLLYARVWWLDLESRPLTRGYLLGFGLAWLLWLLSLALPVPWRFAVWGVAMLVELLIPLYPAMRRLQHRWPPDLHHLQERFALFTLIVLGESFIKVLAGLVGHTGRGDPLLLSGAAFVVVGSLWWWYFDRAQQALQGGWPVARYLWIYGHLPLTVAVVAIGVGLKKLVLLELWAPMPFDLGWVLVGASLVAVSIFTLWEYLRIVANDLPAGRMFIRASAVMLGMGLLGAILGLVPVAIFAVLWPLLWIVMVTVVD